MTKDAALIVEDYKYLEPGSGKTQSAADHADNYGTFLQRRQDELENVGDLYAQFCNVADSRQRNQFADRQQQYEQAAKTVERVYTELAERGYLETAWQQSGMQRETPIKQ